MKSTQFEHAATHGLHQLGPLIEASRQAAALATSGLIEGDEVEIDVDQEIASLAQLSGVAAGSHGSTDMHAFVAWIADVCADTADRGGGRVELGKAAAVAARHHGRPWRNLACLLARRCATLSSRYGADEGSALPGEVIRWLFCDMGTPEARGLH